MKKQTTKSTPVINMTPIFTLLNNEKGVVAGRIMFIYTEAMFTFLGAFTSGRKTFSASNVKLFYKTASIFSHHKGKGNIEKTKKGYRLTVSGLNYFSGRRNTKTGGIITDADIADAVNFIKTGVSKGTPFENLHHHKANIYIPAK